MHLFLDANVWLSFYHYTSEDLEELRKVAVLIDTEKLTLYLPDQVQFEFIRNRDVKFADALKQFKQDQVRDTFPQVCKEYAAEYEAMRKALEQYRSNKNSLIEKLTKDFRASNLKADSVITTLMEKAKSCNTDKIVDKAQLRYQRGNPPGKDHSLGDAINWECLLANVPDGEDLYLIADDKDFRGATEDDEISPFLQWEWKEVKSATVYYYRRLSAFFKAKFPEIKLATELEKNILIAELIGSGSYVNTRKVLTRLSRFDDFTLDQVTEIVFGALTNGQVARIGKDEDISKYMTSIVTPHLSSLDVFEQEALHNRFKVPLLEPKANEQV